MLFDLIYQPIKRLCVNAKTEENYFQVRRMEKTDNLFDDLLEYRFDNNSNGILQNYLQDLTERVMDAPLLLLILTAFERLCIPSAHVHHLDQDIPTINTSSFSQISSPIEAIQGNALRYMSKHHHNLLVLYQISDTYLAVSCCQSGLKGYLV